MRGEGNALVTSTACSRTISTTTPGRHHGEDQSVRRRAGGAQAGRQAGRGGQQEEEEEVLFFFFLFLFFLFPFLQIVGHSASMVLKPDKCDQKTTLDFDKGSSEVSLEVGQLQLE